MESIETIETIGIGLLVVAVLGSIALIPILAWKPTWIRAWFWRLSERRAYRLVGKPLDQVLRQSDHKLLILTAVVCDFTSIAFNLTGKFAPSAESALVVVREIAAVAVIIVALVSHFRPSHSRTFKYGFLVAGTSILSFPVLNTCLVYGTYVVTSRLINKRWLAPDRKQVLIRRARKAATLCGFGLVATPINIITTPFVTPLLLFRYIVLRKASEAPILYFRSFHYADGPTTFGKLILKIASQYGVVVCVVHESQKGSDLLRYARFASQPITVILPESQWREGVTHLLKSASAAIIDVSLMSEGLQWELETARRFLGDRTMVISEANSSHSAVNEGPAARYRSAADMIAAKALSDWFQTRMLSRSSHDNPLSQAASR
jgi:hypothetical protein